LKIDTLKIKMSDGKNVVLHTFVPDGEIKAVIQLSHGMSEHAMRYEDLAKFFCENGFAFYAHDHRGHGETAESIEEFGFLAEKDGFNRVVEDLATMIKKCKTDFPGKKVFLLSHSFGSFVSQCYIEKYGTEIDGCILCGSAGPRVMLVSVGKFLSSIVMTLQGKTQKSTLLDALIFGSYNSKNQLDGPSAWLTRDKEIQAAFDNDPLCGFKCTNEFFYHFLGGLANIHKKKNMEKIPKNLPIFIISGDADPVGEYGKSIGKLYSAYRKLGINDVSMKLYPEARHELFNELNKEDVKNDVLVWILSYLE
jgi:alpha-beta hydrolase superfamily lysophospholipase